MKTKSLNNFEGAWAAAGFSLVLIIVGLPIWWWTTTVYRAALPYQTIDKLSLHRLYHTIQIIVIADKPFIGREQIKKQLQSNDTDIKFLVYVRPPDKQELTLLHTSKTVESLDEELQRGRIFHTGTLSLYLLPVNSSLIQPSQIVLSKRRIIYLHDGPDFGQLGLPGIIQAMALDPVAKLQMNGKKNARTIRRNVEFSALRQVPTEPSYDVTLTLMLPQPHLMKAEWDIREATEAYLGPLVKQLEGIADLRVRSQVLYMTSMKISPRWSSKYKHYLIPEQQLPLTINAIEAKLGTFVSTRPALHFIIYVPSELQSPLHIHDKEGIPIPSNSFLVPRWGGIMIHNPPADLLAKDGSTSLPKIFPVDLQWVMSTVVAHLHLLFPIPSLEIEKKVCLLGERHANSLTDWQLDGLARARVLSYLHDIKITLQSLCDLVGEISNMVVSDEVAGWVWSAVGDWQACIHASREGRLKEATQYCEDAFVFADAAFFHPSMLALLYFPDNQKYAIYVPLFLPVSIPVVFSLSTIWKLLPFRKQKVQ